MGIKATSRQPFVSTDITEAEKRTFLMMFSLLSFIFLCENTKNLQQISLKFSLSLLMFEASLVSAPRLCFTDDEGLISL